MRTTVHLLAAAIALGVMAGAVFAQGVPRLDLPPAAAPTGPVDAAKPKPRVSGALFAPTSAAALGDRRLTPQQRDEWRFLKVAAASSRFETEAARMALAKSASAGVRSYARAVIERNTPVGNELLHLLQMRGMAAPMLANDQRKTLNRLAKMQGKKFDREFVAQVALRHQQQDLLEFERASTQVQDPQIKAWIARTLPTMQDQLNHAEQLFPATTARAYKDKAPAPLLVRTRLAPKAADGPSRARF